MHDTYDNDKLSAGDSKVIYFDVFRHLRYAIYNGLPPLLPCIVIFSVNLKVMKLLTVFLISIRSRSPPIGAYWESAVEQPPSWSSSSKFGESVLIPF